MGRDRKPTKGKAKPATPGRSAAHEDARVRDLEKRLAEALKDRAEALEQQTATSEILRVISSSATDIQRVFDAIAERAMQLCHASSSGVLRFDGKLVHIVALGNVSQEGAAALRSAFPVAPNTRSASTRAILTCRVVHIPDILEDAEYGIATQAQAGGFRSVLSVPMLRERKAIGGVTVGRPTPGRFSESEVALLQTFADQAVIAIENARLFTELQHKNEALTQAHAQVTDALERQTATAEILRIINTSQQDLNQIFDVIARNAARLCEADLGGVILVDNGQLVPVGSYGFSDVAASRYPRPVDTTSHNGRAIVERRIIHVPDIVAEPSQMVMEDLAQQRPLTSRSQLSVPMMRGDTPIGVVVVARHVPGPFAEAHIDLLRTFADQAAIASGNARLFNETQDALERQTATSEILRVISSSPTDIQPVFDAVVESAARLCEANDVAIYRREGDRLRFVAHQGSIPPPGPVGEYVRPLERGSVTGRSVLEAQLLHVADVQTTGDEFPTASDLAQRLGFRTLLSVPLMREGAAIGTIMVRRTEARLFTERQVALLKTFADQAVIAIENVRLFNETKEALEQQTATAEILRVISESPTDIRPVFAAVLDRALALCEASNGSIYQLEDGALRHVGLRGPHLGIAVGDVVPLESSPGRAILEKRTLHLEDVLQELDWHAPEVQAGVRRAGLRTTVSVPLLREQTAIGAIVVRRLEVRPFSEKQIRLLQTFADQAVIAIENVRLFTELQSSNRELRVALEQQTATSELLKVIGRSTFDLQPVFETLVENAVRLCGAEQAFVYRFDGQLLRVVASHNATCELREFVEQNPIAPGRHSGSARAALERQTIHIHDVQTDPEYTFTAYQVDAYRTVLAIPMLRSDELLGVILIYRYQVQPFNDSQIALMETFADQAAIAIENARLLKELEASNREIAEKSRQIEVASQHKSEFLANMSHELRTPLNAIIGFSEVLSERMFGELNEKQEEYSKDIHASGQHLLSLINDILDLSKIEAGRMELELTDFHLPTAFDNALTLVRERAGRRSINLQMSVDEGLGEVRADERKIRQVVLNLLSNAIKFTPEGGRIEVGALPRDGYVEVSVSDTGVGIAPEDQEAVFEEFRQVGTAEKKAEGTGLGLTLCRKFIELHGGRIWVKSQVGVGSTFTFTIPLRHGE